MSYYNTTWGDPPLLWPCYMEGLGKNYDAGEAMRVGDLYYIEWLDAATNAGHEWRQKKEVDSLSPQPCKSVGWIHKITDTGILLVSTKDAKDTDDSSYWGEIVIPKGCITKKRKLR